MTVSALESQGVEPLFEVHEAAQRLRCGRTHVFALIARGDLGSVLVGRKRLVPASSLVNYVEGLKSVQAL